MQLIKANKSLKPAGKKVETSDKRKLYVTIKQEALYVYKKYKSLADSFLSNISLHTNLAIEVIILPTVIMRHRNMCKACYVSSWNTFHLKQGKSAELNFFPVLKLCTTKSVLFDSLGCPTSAHRYGKRNKFISRTRALHEIFY